MSRTTRKQAEWTLHRALDDLIEEGGYPLATDAIVVQSVEERIVMSLAANTAVPPLALMCASRFIPAVPLLPWWLRRRIHCVAHVACDAP